MRTILLGLLGLLSACSPATLLNAVTPVAETRIIPDLSYGADPRQVLDVYAPPGSAGPAPVVVFLYGGGWQSGERAMYRFLGTTLARRGMVTIVPDYRLYPAVRFPDFLRDAAHATAWARREAASYGGDPRRIVLMGHSAGAYLAMMLAMDPRWLAEVGLRSDGDVVGVIGLAGPYDFLPPDDPDLAPIFPDPPAVSQPIGFARGDAPPVMLLHGGADGVVRPAQSERMAAAIRARGGRAELRAYRGVGHAALVGAIAPPLRWLAPVADDVTEFVAATRAGGGWWSQGESNP